MTLEQLQAKTDKELNRIAAVQILWGGIVNVPSDEWNPTVEKAKGPGRIIRLLRGGLRDPDGGDYPLKWMSQPKEE